MEYENEIPIPEHKPEFGDEISIEEDSAIKAIKNALNVEGGFYDDPNIKGEKGHGYTQRGIVYGFHKKYLEDELGITSAEDFKKRGVTEEEAISFYKKNYWDRSKVDRLPEQMRDTYFHLYINNERRARQSADEVRDALDIESWETATPEQAYKANQLIKLQAAEDYITSPYKNRTQMNGVVNRYLGVDEFGTKKVNLNEMEENDIIALLHERYAGIIDPPVPKRKPLTDGE